MGCAASKTPTVLEVDAKPPQAEQTAKPAEVEPPSSEKVLSAGEQPERASPDRQDPTAGIDINVRDEQRAQVPKPDTTPKPRLSKGSSTPAELKVTGEGSEHERLSSGGRSRAPARAASVTGAFGAASMAARHTDPLGRTSGRRTQSVVVNSNRSSGDSADGAGGGAVQGKNVLRKGLPVRGDAARLARRRSSAVRGSLLAAAPGAANSPPKAVGSGSRWVDFLPADIGRLDAAKREADRETLRMCLSSHFMLHSASEEQMDALVQSMRHKVSLLISSSSSSSTQ